MMQIRRPVFVSGENPGMTLYESGTERAAAVASYCQCELTPWGVGRALILWLPQGMTSAGTEMYSGVYTDNPEMAMGLVSSLTQHFPEFHGIPLAELACVKADCMHAFDGGACRVACKTARQRIDLEWAEVLDRMQMAWSRFPAGKASFDLTTAICPSARALVRLDGVALTGEPTVAQTAEGTTGSSAFLAFAETWIAPLADGDDWTS
jgi:hypothetical protein